MTYLKIISIWLSLAALVSADSPEFEIELYVQRNAPIDAAQQWAQQLETLKPKRVRIQSSNELEPSVQTRTIGKRPRFLVYGAIDSQGKLRLANNRTFRVNQILSNFAFPSVA